MHALDEVSTTIECNENHIGIYKSSEVVQYGEFGACKEKSTLAVPGVTALVFSTDPENRRGRGLTGYHARGRRLTLSAVSPNQTQMFVSFVIIGRGAPLG